MTQDRLFELLPGADAVYVVVEVSKNNPTRIPVDAEVIRRHIEIEGCIFGDDLLVCVDRERAMLDPEGGFAYDLVIGTDEASDDLYEIEWNSEHQRAAQRQGWDIFERWDDGEFELQHLDDPEGAAADRFEAYTGADLIDDLDAARLVQEAADTGDELAIRAIRFLIERRSKDVGRFNLHL